MHGQLNVNKITSSASASSYFWLVSYGQHIRMASCPQAHAAVPAHQHHLSDVAWAYTLLLIQRMTLKRPFQPSCTCFTFALIYWSHIEVQEGNIFILFWNLFMSPCKFLCVLMDYYRKHSSGWGAHNYFWPANQTDQLEHCRKQSLPDAPEYFWRFMANFFLFRLNWL